MNTILQDLYEYPIEVQGGLLPTTSNSSYIPISATIPSVPIEDPKPTKNIGLAFDDFLNGLNDYRSINSLYFTGAYLGLIAAIGTIAVTIRIWALRILFIIIASVVSFELEIVVSMSIIIMLLFINIQMNNIMKVITALVFAQVGLFFTRHLINYNSSMICIFDIVVIVLMAIGMNRPLSITAGSIEESYNYDENILHDGYIDDI